MDIAANLYLATAMALTDLRQYINSNLVQATTAIMDMVIVESTAIVEHKPLTTQFYLLLVESPL